MNGIRIQTTLFEIAAALQSVCDDDREIVQAMTRWLSPGRRVVLARPPSRPAAGAQRWRPQDARALARRCD